MAQWVRYLDYLTTHISLPPIRRGFDPGLVNYSQRLSRACIVHLVIKRINWSYVKTMSCSGSHLGIPINIRNMKFEKDLPMIDAQFRFNLCNSFREENVYLFSPYGPVLILWPVVAAILDLWIGIKNSNFLEGLQMIIPGQFAFHCPSGIREEAFWKMFPIGFNVKLNHAVATILNFISEQKT